MSHEPQPGKDTVLHMVRHRAAAAIAELADLATLGMLSEATYSTIADDVSALLEGLGDVDRAAWFERPPEFGSEWRAMSPFRGTANPRAPGLDITERDDGVVGVVTVGPAFAGPPGCVHGGLIAGLCDEMVGALGRMLSGSGTVVTARLTIRYRAPTPLNVPLRFVARAERSTQRRLRATVACFAGSERTAEAEGLLVKRNPRAVDTTSSGR